MRPRTLNYRLNYWLSRTLVLGIAMPLGASILHCSAGTSGNWIPGGDASALFPNLPGTGPGSTDDAGEADAGSAVEPPGPDGSCAAGKERCGESCVDITANADHCGGCGQRCQAPTNGVPNCKSGSCSVKCNAGFNYCNGACVAESGDSCGATCTKCTAPQYSTAECKQGQCAIVCNAGYNRCANPSYCVRDDETACGASCTRCPTPPVNAYAYCSAGRCDTTCQSGAYKCGSRCAKNDATACGQSCSVCPVPTGGTAFCDTNECRVRCSDTLAPCSTGCCASRVYTQIAAGGDTTCALVSDGTVKCWGKNSSGQVGDATTQDKKGPTTVFGLTGIQSIAVGASHACAKLSNGTAKCWGDDNQGQLGNSTIFGRSSSPVEFERATGVTALAAGGWQSCVVTTYETWCVGYWGFGVYESGYRVLVAGDSHVCIITPTGTVKCGGINTFGQVGTPGSPRGLVEVPGITGATALAAGDAHSCALVTGGTVKCWGWNKQGQLGNGSTLDSTTAVTATGISGASAITAGAEHTCAIVGGQVKCWGYNDGRQLGQAASVLVRNSAVPLSVDKIASAKSIAAGKQHTCALLTTGKAVCWGSNTYGQTGTNALGGDDSPEDVWLE